MFHTPAIRAHFPITVSGENPCPDKGSSFTARAACQVARAHGCL